MNIFKVNVSPQSLAVVNNQLREGTTDTTNILLIGIAGTGKSTVVNALMKKSVAAVGAGTSVTSCFNQYTSTIRISNNTQKLVVFDSKGLEYSNHAIFFSELKEFISEKNSSNSNDHIHLIWIIISGEDDRPNYQVYQTIESICKDFSIVPLYVITKIDLFLNRKSRRELDSFYAFTNVFYIAVSPSGYPKFCPTCGSENITIKKSDSRVKTICDDDKSHKINDLRKWWSQDYGFEKLMDKSLSMLPEAQRNAFLSSQLFCLETKKLMGLKEIRGHCYSVFQDQNTTIKRMENRLNEIWGIKTTVKIDDIISTARNFITSPLLNIIVGVGTKTLIIAYVGLYVNTLLYNMALDMINKFRNGCETLNTTERECKPDYSTLWGELCKLIFSDLKQDERPSRFINDTPERKEKNNFSSDNIIIENLTENLETLRNQLLDKVKSNSQSNCVAKTIFQKRLLCMDGGGIRGLVILETLEVLEKVTGKKIHQLFDVICGTSTGGLLALFLGLLKLSISEARELYLNLGVEVFSKKNPIFSSASLFDNVKVEAILKNIFSDKKFGDYEAGPDTPHVFVVSNIATTAPPTTVLFANYSSQNTFKKYPLDIPLWEAARATSAAPMYFSPHKLSFNGDILIDGGIGGNNPAGICLTEVTEMFGRDNIHVILSLGSGYSARSSNYGYYSHELLSSINRSSVSAPSEGAELDTSYLNMFFGYASSIASATSRLSEMVGLLHSLIDASTSTESVHIILKSLVPKSYFRIQPLIEDVDLGESNIDILDAMMVDTVKYLKTVDWTGLLPLIIEELKCVERELTNN